MGTTQPAVASPEPAYTMPPELEKVLRPMSQAEAEAATLKDLVRFWRRPPIKFSQPGACPCCGGVHRLKSYGLCSGCYSDKIWKNNVTGLALLEHLARRSAKKGAQAGRPPGKKNIKKSISPASVPSSHAAPSAGAGQVESPDSTKALHQVLHEIHTVMALDDTVPFAEIPKQVGRIIEERDRLQGEARDIAIALRMTEQAREAKWSDGLVAEEEIVVAKWSALPVPAGYEALTGVLEEAINQAANGKGLERHADGRPFHDQPILREALAVGLGFPAGQARKKILEAVRCCGDHPERAVADLLGAINYTAALVIAIRAMMVEQAA